MKLSTVIISIVLSLFAVNQPALAIDDDVAVLMKTLDPSTRSCAEQSPSLRLGEKASMVSLESLSVVQDNLALKVKVNIVKCTEKDGTKSWITDRSPSLLEYNLKQAKSNLLISRRFMQYDLVIQTPDERTKQIISLNQLEKSGEELARVKLDMENFLTKEEQQKLKSGTSVEIQRQVFVHALVETTTSQGHRNLKSANWGSYTLLFKLEPGEFAPVLKSSSLNVNE